MSSTRKQTITKEIEVSQENDPQIKIAVMNNDIKHVNETLARIEQKFDSAIQGFVTTDVLSSAIQASELKHAEQDKAIKGLEDWNTWAIRILAGSILTFLSYLVLQSGLIHK